MLDLVCIESLKPEEVPAQVEALLVKTTHIVAGLIFIELGLVEINNLIMLLEQIWLSWFQRA